MPMEVGLPFRHVGSGDNTQIFRLSARFPDLLGHPFVPCALCLEEFGF